MLCCAILVLLFAVAGQFVRRHFRRKPAAPSALEWRPHADPSEAIRAHSDPPRFSLNSRVRSFTFAVDGLRFMIFAEHNARIHLVATAVVITAGIMAGLEMSEWRWIVLAIVLVWFGEALNTAIEYLCDVVSPGSNELVRRAKDISAGAVLVTAVGAALIGMCVFLPHLAPDIFDLGKVAFTCRSAANP